MAAVGFPMLLAAYIFLILPLFSSCGLPEYGTTDFGQFLDPVGMALTTAHDVRVRHFGIEKLHSCFVPGRCTDVPAAASPAASVFFSRGTHKVRDDLQLSHFVGWSQGSGLRFWVVLTLTITITPNIFTTLTQTLP